VELVIGIIVGVLVVTAVAVLLVRRRPTGRGVDDVAAPTRPRPGAPGPAPSRPARGRPPSPTRVPPAGVEPAPGVEVPPLEPLEAPPREPAAPAATTGPTVDELLAEETLEAPPEEAVEEEAPPAVRPRLRDRLGKARAALAATLGGIRSGEVIDDDTWDELEEALIRADVGVAATQRILDDLRERARSDKPRTPSDLLELLKADLVDTLGTGDRSLVYQPGTCNVWLFVGVNGVGKTTTIGKLARREVAGGRRIVMAAGDTFRAAAAEQLGLWADRAGVDIVRGQEGADPGSVVYDAVASARSKDADLVLVDTAGRLHTKVNLMAELEKVRRIIVDKSGGALQEVLLVLDATTGQNGLQQARQFCESVGVTGVVLTKLDGTAKGGIVLAIQHELGIPVKIVGVGESADDLVEFDPVEFVEALFAA
jgi:fused signal recognition particle receptor